VVVTCFKALFQHFPEWNAKNKGNVNQNR